MTAPEQITAREAAVLEIAALERRGAVFTLRDDDTWFCDLDTADITDRDEAEDIIQFLFTISDEIRAVLQGLKVRH